jgi:hypothetical protein
MMMSKVKSLVMAAALLGAPTRASAETLFVGLHTGASADERAAEQVARGEAQRLLAVRVADEPPAPVVRLAPGDPARVGRQLQQGVDAFFAIEIDAAREALEQAFAALQADPTLLEPGGVARTAVEAGLLTLARVALHEGRDAEATQVVQWLLRTWPDVLPTEASYPAGVVTLVQAMRSDLAGRVGLVGWTSVGGGSGCHLLVDGVDRGSETPVPVAAGEVTVQVRCEQGDGWRRRVSVEAGRSTLVRSAVPVEARLTFGEGAVRPTEPLDAAGVGSMRALSDALGAPLLVASVVEGRVVVQPVDADGVGQAPGVQAVEAEPVMVEASEDPPTLLPWAWASAGAAVALAAGGLTLHLVHDARVRETASPAPGAIDDARTMEAAAIGLYAGAGAAAVGSIVLFVLHETDEPPPVSASAGPHGLAIFGRF